MRDLKLSRHESPNKAHLPVTQNRDIFIIYISTKAISVHKNDQDAQGWNPITIFFRKLNTMVHDRLETCTTLQI